MAASRIPPSHQPFVDDFDIRELDGVDPSRRAFEGFEIERLIRVNGPSVVAAIKETGSCTSEQYRHTPVLFDGINQSYVKCASTLMGNVTYVSASGCRSQISAEDGAAKFTTEKTAG